MSAPSSSLSPSELKSQLIDQARELGFESVGVVAVPVELRQDYFMRWLEKGMHAEMRWMANNPERRAYPQQLMPEARSIIVCGLNYYQPELERRGRIAKYALGKDYHKIIYKKLKRLCAWLRDQGGQNRPYVDTGPLLEKPIAEQAGIGWQGKNTVILNPTEGQWLFLGNILTTLELPADQPPANRCGSCTRCIDVCPTQAIVAPYELDARKCISYLTIEHPGPIPMEFREAIGDHLFGCDDCLDVCPWNRWAGESRETKLAARPYPDLREMLDWEDEHFHTTFEGTPIRRLKLPRWLRNICVVLGNTGTLEDLPALQKTAQHADPMVAEHAEWAITRIQQRLSHENSP
ncbi:MAG: tRNA epoxyqueuosine(34) reductase QueG [Opitutales bacterium]|nr:tRNA epoxyqueuosine(34) reductase QueG [Opitutales bacterium]